MGDRVQALRAMLERNPNDPRAHFGLASELEKKREWDDVALHLRAYLELAEDQGNAWGRLGNALRELGRRNESIAAYERGIQAAQQHGHPSMAAEFEEIVEGMRT